MKKKQQTPKEQATIEVKEVPFGNELINVIQKAHEYGYKKTKFLELVSEYWEDCFRYVPVIPEESEAQKEFRKKVNIFMDAKYDEFDAFAYENKLYCSGLSRYWRCTERLEVPKKKELICEAAAAFFKAYELDSVDRNELKEIVYPRIKVKFPKFGVGEVQLIISEILAYTKQYPETVECTEFLDSFELHNLFEKNVCKFVWMVENFQP